MNEYSTKKYQQARTELLADNPLCHWCRRAPATELDHLIETDRGGSIDDGYVASCKPCNARRGANHLNNRRANQQRTRNAAMTQSRQNTENTTDFFDLEKPLTPTPFLNISKANQPSFGQIREYPPLGLGIASDKPRLVTPENGQGTYGPLIADWASANLDLVLFPWQVEALRGAFSHDDTGKFVHSSAIVSSGRQNGKTSMLSAVVGWALLELPRIWGRPVRILSTAHELSLATEVFESLRDTLELWEESGLCKVTWAYGRHKVKMVDGSVWVVKAATGKKHGGTYDLILADELWALSEAAIFGALRPSQIAVPSPLMLMTSTAGDESSKTYSKLREQALGIIDSGVPGDLFMAEWSLPSGVDPLDKVYWGYANPSLGRTITVRGLEAAAAAPDRSQFLRAHCNLWVAAASSWMPPGVWAKRKGEAGFDGSASVLAVDSATDESKYVGIWCRLNTDGQIVASVAFSVESNEQMWVAIEGLMDNDKSMKLAITPTLDLHTPFKYQTRKMIWGYGELLKYTGLIRSMIIEGRLIHTGEEMLSEHINRAVLVRAQGSVVISSQRSPGPIECARCLIAAASFVSKPRTSKKPTMGISR